MLSSVRCLSFIRSRHTTELEKNSHFFLREQLAQNTADTEMRKQSSERKIIWVPISPKFSSVRIKNIFQPLIPLFPQVHFPIQQKLSTRRSALILKILCLSYPIRIIHYIQLRCSDLNSQLHFPQESLWILLSDAYSYFTFFFDTVRIHS